MAKSALTMLKTNKSVKTRAEQYESRIASSLNIKMLLPLKEKIEAVDDKIFDLEDFSLDTNLNKGMKKMSKEECEARFEKIINLKFEKELLSQEYASKAGTFKDLFGEVTVEV